MTVMVMEEMGVCGSRVVDVGWRGNIGWWGWGYTSRNFQIRFGNKMKYVHVGSLSAEELASSFLKHPDECSLNQWLSSLAAHWPHAGSF